MERFPDLSDVELVCSDPAGEVYRAHHPDVDHAVAVQVLAAPVADDESVQRFEQACRDVRGLAGHPHVVTVHAWGLTEDGKPYVVTDFVDGGSLAGRLRESGPLPVADGLAVGMAVAGALASAHERGAVHGDVRPGCILLAPSGEPELGGFGLSALAADPTSGAPLPAHAAPEVVDGGRGDAASDLHALGSTLLTLLTGCGPEAALVDCLSRRHEPGTHQPALLPPGADGEPLPDSVVEVLARLTATNPAERPDGAGAALDAFSATAEALGLPTSEHAWAAPEGEEADDGPPWILEPQLTLLFDTWAEPGVTRPPAPRGELLSAPEDLPLVKFAPPGPEDDPPLPDAREVAASHSVAAPRRRRRAVPLVAAALLVAAAGAGVLVALVTGNPATAGSAAVGRGVPSATPSGVHQLPRADATATSGATPAGATGTAPANGVQGPAQADSSPPATAGTPQGQDGSGSPPPVGAGLPAPGGGAPAGPGGSVGQVTPAPGLPAAPGAGPTIPAPPTQPGPSSPTPLSPPPVTVPPVTTPPVTTPPAATPPATLPPTSVPPTMPSTLPGTPTGLTSPAGAGGTLTPPPATLPVP